MIPPPGHIKASQGKEAFSADIVGVIKSTRPEAPRGMSNRGGGMAYIGAGGGIAVTIANIERGEHGEVSTREENEG